MVDVYRLIERMEYAERQASSVRASFHSLAKGLAAKFHCQNPPLPLGFTYNDGEDHFTVDALGKRFLVAFDTYWSEETSQIRGRVKCFARETFPEQELKLVSQFTYGRDELTDVQYEQGRFVHLRGNETDVIVLFYLLEQALKA